MIIALNNKCNLLKDEFSSYQRELAKLTSQKSNIILCPSTPYISMFNLENIELGSQNVSKNDIGAHTGEVSASQLASLNVKYCIIGHSERRQELYETSDDINLKIKNLLEKNITPILCVGETKQEKDNAKTTSKISKQIEIATKDLTQDEKSKIIVAYEPIWSIGTGLIPTIEEIDTTLSLIKELLPGVKTLYGGSANEENIEYLKKSELIDGYLLGGLSLKPAKLQIFINKAEN